MPTNCRVHSGSRPARLITFLLIGFAVTLLASAPSITQSKKPINKDGLLEAVRLNGLSTQQLIRRIQQRGVSFQLTAADESEFRAAGARPDLIEAVRTNYRPVEPSFPRTPNPPRPNPRDPVLAGPPLSKDQIVAMLQGGISAARVEQFVEARGVNFTVTPEITREIATAGGNRSLLGAIAEKVGAGTTHPTETPNSSLDYDDLTDRATAAINANGPVEAVRLLKQAIGQDPSRPIAYQLLGTVQLYNLRAPAEAEKSMRAAIERGGEARFTVYHDHGQLFTAFCEGSLFVSKSSVTFKATLDGKDTFEAADSVIGEAKLNKKVFGMGLGVKYNSFHIKVAESNGKTKNYNFAPATGKEEESKLIIFLIQNYQ